MQDRHDDGGRDRYRQNLSYGISALIGAVVVMAIGRVVIGGVIAVACVVYLAVVWVTQRPRGEER
jgi:hypothetical protein